MLGALTSGPSLTDLLAQQEDAHPLRDDWLIAADLALVRAQDALARQNDAAVADAALDLGRLRRELEATMEGTREDLGSTGLTPERIRLADRLADFNGEMERCLLGLPHPHTRTASRVKRNANFLDWSWAIKNAARAGLTVLIAGALWFETAFPSGAIMMTGVIPTIGLFALHERPSRAVIDFVWGVVAAAATTTPWPAFVAAGFSVFFITLVAPSNPMVYDPTGFLNNAYALIVGAGLTALAYQLILPVDARMLRRHLLIDLQRDLAAVLRGRKSMRAEEWESRMHDRMRLLTARLRGANMGGDAPLRSGFDAIRLGLDILRLRALLELDPEALAIARRGVAPMAKGKAQGAVLQALKASVEALRALGRRPEGAAQAIRAQANLHSIAAI
jgi:uncharacterized membrane protein YccC